MTSLMQVISKLRPTIFVALFALLLLWLPDQVREIYLIDLEAMSPGEGSSAPTLWSVMASARNWAISVIAGIAGIVAIIILWGASYYLSDLGRSDETTPRPSKIAIIFVVLTASAPALGVLAGAISLWLDVESIAGIEKNYYSAAINTFLWLSASMAITTLCAVALVTIARPRLIGALSSRMFDRWGISVGLVVIFAVTAATTIWPTHFSGNVGTIALAFFFIAALAFVLTWFSDIFRRTGWPVTVGAIAFAFLASWVGLNDNHEVDYELAYPLTQDAYERSSNKLEDAFFDWYRQRADHAYYERLPRDDQKNDQQRGVPYPVYIVAAEGGGMYAGYHVASFLAQMQDTCPNFAQHTFAISSVSGGSLGAGVFAALTQSAAYNVMTEPCDEKRDRYFENATYEFFKADLLSPLIGATLFPDLLQRLLPFPIRSLDRAQALQQGFEGAWSNMSAKVVEGDKLKPQFQKTLQELWNPAGANPALLLNTTAVANGSRYTLSPLLFEDTPSTFHYRTALCPNWEVPATFTLSLPSAISLSARFPWLTPVGWLRAPQVRPLPSSCKPKGEPDTGSSTVKGQDRIYLGDGGYFENSGLEAAVELKARLLAYANAYPTRFPNGISITIIMVSIYDQFAARFTAIGDRMSASPGEILSPLSVMLNTRRAKTRAFQLQETYYDSSFRRLDRTAGPLDDAKVRKAYKIRGTYPPLHGIDDVHEVAFDARATFLPLGWRLSERSLRLFSGQMYSTRKSFVRELIMRELAGKETGTLKDRY